MNKSIPQNSLEKIKHRNLLAILLTKLLHGFGTNIFTIIYQPFLLKLTNSILITGIIISIGSVMQFLPMPIIGKISDRYNRKILIFISIAIYIIGLLLFIIANPTAIYYAILGIILYFLGFTINGLNTQFIVAESTTKSKGLMYGLTFFSYFLGSIGGSIIVIFAGNIGVKSFFLIFIGILAIEGLIFGILLSNKTQISNSPIIYKGNETRVNLWIKILKTKSLRSVLIFFTLDIFVYGITLSIYYGVLYDYYYITMEDLAILLMCMNITNIIFQIPAGKLTDKLGKKKTLILSAIFGLGFFSLNIFTACLWINEFISVLLLSLIFGEILLALSLVTFAPVEQIILTDLDKDRKGELYGIVSFIRGVGYIPTGYLGGLIVERLGYANLFILSFMGVLIEIVFLLKFFRPDPYPLDEHMEL